MDLDVLTDRFFDGESLSVEAATVRVRGGRIERIDHGLIAPARGRLTLDARGSLLAPGLVNAHVHIARALADRFLVNGYIEAYFTDRQRTQRSVPRRKGPPSR